MQQEAYQGLLPPGLHEEISNAMIPTIKLSEFATGFWHAFTGRIQDEAREREVLAFWVQQVAGNPSTPVDVVHDHTGKKLARIPPVLSSGNTSNLIELFNEIREAKKQSKADNPSVAVQRMNITKEQIMGRYENNYLQSSVGDWITLYNLIEGGLPEGSDTDIDISESGISTPTTDIKWE